MANVTLMGASYSDVPAVTLPQTGGGTVTFYENGGGGTVSKERKDVNFYDYDGTIVESYTTAEFADISALPANPTHEGLTAQGWNMPSNWTLANAKTYISTNKKADWGQMYTTTSGKTEIDVEFTDPNRMSPNMSLAVNGEVSIDWGDGSSAVTVTGTSLTTRKNPGAHTYPAVGKYTIKITSVSGSWGFYCTTSYYILYKSDATNSNKVYSNCVKAVRIGTGCTSIGQYAFYYCTSLGYITIPNTITSIKTYAFANSGSIPVWIIPNSVTEIGTYAFRNVNNNCVICFSHSVTSISDGMFYNSYSLADIIIPNGVTSIGNSAFYSHYTQSQLIIPSSVTSIATKAFYGNYGLGSIHFKGSTPPTVGASDAFSNVPTDCKIYVPAGKLSAYTSASNYPSSSTYTYIEE